MLEHGCDTVILAITEFDVDFWFPNINPIVKKAHEMGLRVLADTWGIGKYFGGEQISLFLQNNTEHRQVSAYTGEKLNAACFNSQSFRDYFNGICLKLARETEVDGFFWDEPHYALPEGLINGGGHDWTCRCNECMKKFKDYYGYEMPRIANDDVRSFRWREALFTLSDVSRRIKEVNPNLEITCCVHATLDSYYVTELRAMTDGKWWQPARTSTCSPPPSLAGASPRAFLRISPSVLWTLPASMASSVSAGLWAITSSRRILTRSTGW